MSDIDLIPVSGLSGMNFFIPSYQRGYRWTEQQVKDLLNDINEFDPKGDSYYCLQPVVVKQKEPDEQILSDINGKDDFKSLEEVKESLQGEWEVIDGQQRLTTIFLILKFLGKSLYRLRYATREGSEAFLDKVGSKDEDKATAAEKEKGKNIDYHHIWEAYKCIEKWFNEHDEHGDIKNIFAYKLLNGTKFIWYKTEEDPVEVFTRINMWKIPLTNGELVKALFLNRMNFGEDEKIQSLKQQEIATQWDEIEYALRDNDFWFFFNQGEYKEPTRIDAILDIMRERDQEGYEKGEMDGADLGVICHIKNNPGVKGEDGEKVDKVLGKGNDKYRTFRYFYYYFKEMSDKSKSANEVAENPKDDTEKKEWIGEKGWNTIKEIFQTFKDWYDDVSLYHYVSFLVDNDVNVKDLLSDWNTLRSKELFLNRIIEKIKGKICCDLDETPKKLQDCRPLLLLYNIQTVINQAENVGEEYGCKEFYRFPFYIYRKEGWDIEHIDSNTHNELTDRASQKEWLYYVYEENTGGDRRDMIDKFLANDDWNDFDELKKNLDVHEDGESSDDEKNKIKNFALLDSNTNRGYGNSIFSAKRRKIIDKDQGKKSHIEVVDGKLEVVPDKFTGKTPFIPPCTKNVFLKYYSPTSTSNDANSWTPEDKKYYLQNIYDTLSELFGVTSKEVKKK